MFITFLKDRSISNCRKLAQSGHPGYEADSFSSEIRLSWTERMMHFLEAGKIGRQKESLPSTIEIYEGTRRRMY
jgi:hypothetical protein